jgi:drug/metabolite transporter (DMT)-like permease
MTPLFTALALLAFAANSLLCRSALGSGGIDPVSFTAVRLLSGAVVLWLLSRILGERQAMPAPAPVIGGSWRSGLALFAYAAAFSLAYVSLSAGVGALLLFGSVQVTMLATAMRSGNGLDRGQAVGFAAAAAGLVVLVLPGITAPSPLGALLMAVAGVAWGIYTMRGRSASAPVRMTAGNFVRSVPFALLSLLPAIGSLHSNAQGLVLALASGTVTSGLGYVIWYRALRGLSVAQASVLQLLVPVLAAFGGVVLLGEQLSVRLAGASLLILGGVALAARRPRAAVTR